MKRLIISEEDKKQILSLYKRCPTINEGVVCDDVMLKKVDTTKERVEKLLPSVIKFWKDWLEDPITKQKIKSDNNFDDKQLSDLYTKYITKLGEVKIVGVGECTEKNGSGFYAYVTKDDSEPNIYVNLMENYGKSDEFIEETLVHEIQHLLYFIQPMSPDLKLDKCFEVQTKKQVTNLKTKIKNIFRKPKKPKINYKNIMDSFGISETEAAKVYNFIQSELIYQNKIGKLYEIIDKNEIYSRIMELRKRFNIKPGGSLTAENFKSFIDTLLLSDETDEDIQDYFDNLNSLSPGAYRFLLYWGYIGYPNLETILNQLNTLALQQNKQTDKFV